MTDETIREGSDERKYDAWLEESASKSIWSDFRWFLMLVVPAGLLIGVAMAATAPEKAADIPTWFIVTACVIFASGIGCVIYIPCVAHLTLGRFLMSRMQPDGRWGRKPVSAGLVTTLLLLWLGAILTPFVFRVDIATGDIGLWSFLLATLLGACICLALVIAEMAVCIPALIVVSVIRRRRAKRSGERDP